MIRSIAKRVRLCISADEKFSFGRFHQRELGNSGAWKQLRLPLLALLLSLATVSGLGQQLATLSGTAKDAAGLAIPDAKITLTNDKTAEGNSGTTDASGDYAFTGLAPGNYTVQ